MSATEPKGEGQAPEVSLTDEVREFGKQLSALIQTALESPTVKEVEQQVTQAMHEAERGLNEVVATVRAKAQSDDWKEQLKTAATTAADETQRGLAQGLRALNEHMARAVTESAKGRAKSGDTGGSGAGDESGGAPPPAAA